MSQLGALFANGRTTFDTHRFWPVAIVQLLIKVKVNYFLSEKIRAELRKSLDRRTVVSA